MKLDWIIGIVTAIITGAVTAYAVKTFVYGDVQTQQIVVPFNVS